MTLLGPTSILVPTSLSTMSRKSSKSIPWTEQNILAPGGGRRREKQGEKVGWNKRLRDCATGEEGGRGRFCLRGQRGWSGRVGSRLRGFFGAWGLPPGEHNTKAA